MKKNNIAILLAGALFISVAGVGSLQASASTTGIIQPIGPIFMTTKLDGTIISLSGSGKGAFDLQLKHKKMTVVNRVNGILASEYTGFGRYYIQVTLSGEDGKTKAQSNLYGSMYSQNVEVDKLNGVEYDYDDILTITHMSPEHVTIKKPVQGQEPEVITQKAYTQRYKLTIDGLKEIN